MSDDVQINELDPGLVLAIAAQGPTKDDVWIGRVHTTDTWVQWFFVEDENEELFDDLCRRYVDAYIKAGLMKVVEGDRVALTEVGLEYVEETSLDVLLALLFSEEVG